MKKLILPLPSFVVQKTLCLLVEILSFDLFCFLYQMNQMSLEKKINTYRKQLTNKTQLHCDEKKIAIMTQYKIIRKHLHLDFINELSENGRSHDQKYINLFLDSAQRNSIYQSQINEVLISAGIQSGLCWGSLKAQTKYLGLQTNTLESIEYYDVILHSFLEKMNQD